MTKKRKPKYTISTSYIDQLNFAQVQATIDAIQDVLSYKLFKEGFTTCPEPRRLTDDELYDLDVTTSLEREYEITLLRKAHTMRVTSELTDAGEFQNIPDKSLVNGHVIEVNDTDPNDPGKPRTTKGKAPCADLTWEVDEGEYAGRKIRFDLIIFGGKSLEGKPISLSRICQFLNKTGVPWNCLDCNNGEKPREFYVATGDSDDVGRGLKKGNYYCPDCKTGGDGHPRVDYDTSNFMGARCGLAIGIRKEENGDREFNTIKGYTALR